MPIEKIIVLEDDLIVRKNLEQQLRNRRYDVAPASTIAQAQDYLSKDTFDLMFVDVRLPDGEGTDLLRELQSRPQRPLVVIITGNGSVESAVECMRNGAFDYMIKPFSADQLEVTLKKAENFNQLLKVNQYLSHEEDDDSGYELLGHSAAIENVRQLIRKVARTQATVLIQGESGTGKELVARALYRQSPRAHAPFIKVNCAAIPENLIESEFFGHEKGAFTGALNKREGRFELAHGGTILLDEISEISPAVQAKLLRVLQERELERVGGNRTIKVDVRVLATTNRRLEESVDRKEFRQDLFFRLNVVPIHVPPLRERLEDVPFLARQFMQRFARKHGVKLKGISAECAQVLQNHSWPGNVRELQNVIERAVILSSDGGELEADALGLSQSGGKSNASGTASALSAPGATGGSTLSTVDAANIGVAPASNPANLPTDQTVESSDCLREQRAEVLPLSEIEKREILHALQVTKGNRTHAARLLGISIRTLRNKLHDYGVAGKDEAIHEGSEAE